MSPVLLVLVAAIESLPAKIAAALSAELLRLAGIPAPSVRLQKFVATFLGRARFSEILWQQTTDL